MTQADFLKALKKCKFVEDAFYNEEHYGDEQKKLFTHELYDDVFVEYKFAENKFSIFRQFPYMEDDKIQCFLSQSRRDIFQQIVELKFASRTKARFDRYCPFGENEIGLYNCDYNIEDLRDFLQAYADSIIEEKEINMDDLILGAVSISLGNLCAPQDYDSKKMQGFIVNVAGTHALSTRDRVLAKFCAKESVIENITYTYSSQNKLLFRIGDYLNAISLQDYELYRKIAEDLLCNPKIIIEIIDRKVVLLTNEYFTSVHMTFRGQNNFVEEERIIFQERKNQFLEFSGLDFEITNDEKMLFVEDSYEQIYKLAWLKINGYNPSIENLESEFKSKASFKIFGKGGKDNLKGFLMNPSMAEWKDKRIVGLFDFDEAYLCFDGGLKGLYGEILGSEEDCLYRVRKNYDNISAMLLPIPKFRKDIAGREQELKALSVELLLTDDDIKSLFRDSRISERVITRDIRMLQISNKEDFWKKAIILEKEKFCEFVPLFKRVSQLLGLEGK